MPNSVLVFPDDATALEPRHHPPCDKSVISAPLISVQASASQGAGAAGVRHVATGATFSWGSALTLAAATIGMAIIDGASGGATKLWQAVVAVGSIGMYDTGPLNLPGTAATALTAEFSGLVTNATQCVTLRFHDIGNV